MQSIFKKIADEKKLEDKYIYDFNLLKLSPRGRNERCKHLAKSAFSQKWMRLSDFVVTINDEMKIEEVEDQIAKIVKIDDEVN